MSSVNTSFRIPLPERQGAGTWLRAASEVVHSWSFHFVRYVGRLALSPQARDANIGSWKRPKHTERSKSKGGHRQRLLCLKTFTKYGCAFLVLLFCLESPVSYTACAWHLRRPKSNQSHLLTRASCIRWMFL